MSTLRKQWSPSDIKLVVTLWESKTTADIAEELGRTVQAVQGLAVKIRKAGYPLKRKHMTGTLQHLIRETLGI